MRATSMPVTLAATSLSCSARNARPVGVSARLSAIQAPISMNAALIQYQVLAPLARQPNRMSFATGMPSGPPVQRLSVVITSATSMPKPSVAIAR